MKYLYVNIQGVSCIASEHESFIAWKDCILVASSILSEGTEDIS